MRNVWTVIGFSLRTKLMTKAFLMTTAILALIVTIVMNLPFIISMFDEEDQAIKVGLVKSSYPAIEKSLEEAFKQKQNEIILVPYDNATEEGLLKDVKEGIITGYLKFEAAEQGGEQAFPKVTYHSEEDLDFGLQGDITGVLTVLKTQWIVKDSLTADQQQQLNQPVSFDTKKLKTSESGQLAEGGAEEESSFSAESFVVTFALLILFFTSIQMTGNMIASEVTQEKSSRVMEILITSVSPLAQMFGKILAMFILGMIQIMAFIAVAVINLLLPHNQEALKGLDLDISKFDPMLVIYGLILYVFGYFLYATLYASIGSIVSRTEDLAQAVLPITFLSLAAFYIGMFSVSTPNSMLVKVTSFIPFFTPTSMLLRIGLGEYQWWEFWLSIVILLLSVLVFGWLAAKIYRTGVLLYGKRPTWKEVRKAMKAYKI
ncbi:ABC transporter permease [Paenibacillus sp. SC116]|uniref:ABC transporter permease n=1 Tax=Paenibacillus sp. SC116 TaxID=2968986 RepID=UPI00215A1AE5|nr:ABC transporter permease [Paenibacillus sp. SC116]MCR8845158.1 ABC transporter permease [Paenibacillus sp. SC116]